MYMIIIYIYTIYLYNIYLYNVNAHWIRIKHFVASHIRCTRNYIKRRGTISRNTKMQNYKLHTDKMSVRLSVCHVVWTVWNDDCAETLYNGHNGSDRVRNQDYDPPQVNNKVEPTTIPDQCTLCMLHCIKHAVDTYSSIAIGSVDAGFYIWYTAQSLSRCTKCNNLPRSERTSYKLSSTWHRYTRGGGRWKCRTRKCRTACEYGEPLMLDTMSRQERRFCATCADTVASMDGGCPICRSPIRMVLRLYQ